LLILGGIISLAISIKQAKTRVEKHQAKILIFSAIIPVIGNVSNLYATIVPDPTSIFMSVSAMLLGYAITKYKLLAISAVVEKPDGLEKELTATIEPGYNYLVLDDHSNATYALLRALSTRKPGLCVRGKAPASIRTVYKIQKLPIIWITEVESEEQSANPLLLDFEITQSIINFMRENPGATVFVDDVEYLTIKCGFEAVVNFLKGVADVASTTNSTFIVRVRPEFYEEEKRRMLTGLFERSTKAPEIHFEAKMQRTVLYYRKEDTLEKIGKSIPAGEKVRVITRSHPKKVERFFKKAEYYWLTDMDITDIKTRKLDAVDTEFIMALKNAVESGIRYVVIDGWDIVRIKINTEKFIALVKDITDMAYKHKLTLFCVMEKPDEKEKSVIEARFDIVVE
jgi:hypothetical protein